MDDQPEVPDIGPLIGATVTPGLTIIFGERGIARIANDVIRDRLPEVDPAPANVIPINRGASYDREVGVGAPMSEPAVDVEHREERLTFAAVKALMRHKVQGGEGPMGGGGSGRIRTREVKTDCDCLNATAADMHEGRCLLCGRQRRRPIETDAPERHDIDRYQIAGLTHGEQEIYDRIPGEAVRVLRELVGRIIRDEVQEPRIVRGVGKPRYCFSVYDLFEPELRILRRYPGSARRALAEHARNVNANRVREIDAG